MGPLDATDLLCGFLSVCSGSSGKQHTILYIKKNCDQARIPDVITNVFSGNVPAVHCPLDHPCNVEAKNWPWQLGNPVLDCNGRLDWILLLGPCFLLFTRDQQAVRRSWHGLNSVKLQSRKCVLSIFIEQKQIYMSFHFLYFSKEKGDEKLKCNRR